MALQPDFTLFERNKVRAIIECKSGAIGVSEYVRGIGQIFQYEYFFENHLSLKNYGFCQNFNSVLVFPESVLKNNDFNVGLSNTLKRDFKVISPCTKNELAFYKK
ncbi:hypothetical protein VN0985_03500 [Helicobacter pylori]